MNDYFHLTYVVVDNLILLPTKSCMLELRISERSILSYSFVYLDNEMFLTLESPANHLAISYFDSLQYFLQYLRVYVRLVP